MRPEQVEGLEPLMPLAILMSDNQVGRERQPRWPVAPGGGRA
jgi:hypothetical protein